MLNLDHHLNDLEARITAVRKARLEGTAMPSGAAAEHASDLLHAASAVAVLFVQEQLALQAKQPELVPIGHGGPLPPHAGAAAAVALDAPGEERFAALRAWRLERARAEGLSPYIVAFDRTLRLVAREHPRTIEDLAGLPGMGKAKAEKYGAEILKVLGKRKKGLP